MESRHGFFDIENELQFTQTQLESSPPALLQ